MKAPISTQYNYYWHAGGKCYRAVSVAGQWRLCFESKPDYWHFVNDVEYSTPSEAFEEAERLKAIPA
jgi:hypothetical protein